MDNNQQQPQPQDNTISQTGVPTPPIQVENVQYNVAVNKYQSKPALIFTIANTCMAIGLFMLASTLHNITGLMLGFNDENFLQFTISALIPLAVIGGMAIVKLNKLLKEQPAAWEDIKFKSRLRKSFMFFLTLAGLGSFNAIFNFIGIFIEVDEKTVQNSFFSLYYVGGLIIMTLWLYSYQKRTSR